MSKITKAFEAAEEEGRAALIIYLCAGHPNATLTPDLLREAATSGADIIELGIPFSDPTADGPTIQKASEVALREGMNLPKALVALKEARKHIQTPVILFSYYNPILAYGEERFAKDAKKAGADGVLVVDLPPEMASPLVEQLDQHGLDFIPLAAPTSDDTRITKVAKLARSFVYSISMTGITGSKATNLAQAASRAYQLRRKTKSRIAVGFGVRTQKDVAALADLVDGVVVGSAVVGAIEAAETHMEKLHAASSLIKELRAGTQRNTREGVNPAFFHAAYDEEAPWDTGRPQSAILKALERGAIQGDVLDMGCGSGENCLLLASKGHRVLGVDLVPRAIEVAKQKAEQRKLNAEFITADALQLDLKGRAFHTIIDSGVFHVFSDEERHRYVDKLRAAANPGARLIVVCFSDQEPGTRGPRRVTEDELRQSFAKGWTIESLEPSIYETRNPEGAKAWCLVARKNHP